MIGLLAIWLSRPTRHTTYDRTLTVRDKKGAVHEETIHYDEFSAESPKNSVVDALAKCFKVPGEVIRRQLEAAGKDNTESQG